MNKLIKISVYIFVFLAIGGLVISQLAFPMLYDMPKSMGEFSVTTAMYHWKNSQKQDNPKYKSFNVEAFYPAQKQEVLVKYAYQPLKISALKKILPQQIKLPAFLWDQMLSNIHTYTKPDVDIAKTDSKFPVLIYLPGINGVDIHNLYLEELASHGYVIFAIEPPYDLLVSVFPDGKIITVDPALTKAVAQNNRDEIYNYRNEAHIRWSQYIDSAIEHIKKLNSDSSSRFYQKLDTENIGLIGHSHGGAVVTDYCQKNRQCKAGINMDGWTKTFNTGNAFATPFLFLLGQDTEMPEMQDLFKNNQRDTFKKVIIANADHGSFTDGVMGNPWSNLFFGELPRFKDNDKIRREISREIVSFFDKYLKARSEKEK